MVLFQVGVGRSGNEAKLCSEAAHEGLQHTMALKEREIEVTVKETIGKGGSVVLHLKQ